MIQTVNAFRGQQVTVKHRFANPDRVGGAGAVTANTVRFRVLDPAGRLLADSAYHSFVAPATAVPARPDGVLAGQLLASGAGTWLYLFSLPADAPLGRYSVEASATVDGYATFEEVAQVYANLPLSLTLEGELAWPAERELAYRCWLRADQPTTLRLNRGIWQMIQGDRQRRPVDPERTFAVARHESGRTTNLLPLTQLALEEGWTQLVVSAGLFMVPAVDRLEQPLPYQEGDRFANPYWRDRTIYEYDGVQGASPFAHDGRFGPGPLFYLYSSDPHWGARDFGASWEEDYRIGARSGAAPLAGGDRRRLEMLCRPDFLALPCLTLFALPLPAENRLAGTVRDTSYTFDGSSFWLGQTMRGPGPAGQGVLPEFSAGGLSNYYKVDVEVAWEDPPADSTDRVLVGHDTAHAGSSYQPPEQLVSII